MTHRTKPLILVNLGNHPEQISLFLIPSSTAPMVLGVPWLTCKNPRLDWANGSVAAGVLHATHAASTQRCPPPLWRPQSCSMLRTCQASLRSIMTWQRSRFLLSIPMIVGSTSCLVHLCLPAASITCLGQSERRWRNTLQVSGLWLHSSIFLTGQGGVFLC